MGAGGELPGWVSRLVEETFFLVCETHDGMARKEKNLFCLHCCTSLCHNCLPAHLSHPILQVRRYLSQDAVRLDDIGKFVDCSLVWTYNRCNAKLIFLEPKPYGGRKLIKSTENNCFCCERIIPKPFHYCCFICKVQHVVMMQGLDISSLFFKLDGREFTSTQPEILETDSSNPPDDEGFDLNKISANPEEKDSMQYQGSSSGSKVIEKSDSSKRNDDQNILPEKPLSHKSRRKGIPHRSPRD